MITAIITAGGTGSRLPGEVKKQYRKIAGKPLLYWTLQPFLRIQEIDEILITLPRDDIEGISQLLSLEISDRRIRYLEGGVERQESVFNALQSCNRDCSFVMIHDGVRPFINEKEISLLLSAVEEYQAVIPVFRVKNTVKKVKDGRVIATVDRHELYNVMTPQVFRFGIILDCHRQAHEQQLLCTDDAALLEYYGYPVHVIETSALNFKITDEEDLRLANLLIEKSDLSSKKI